MLVLNTSFAKVRKNAGQSQFVINQACIRLKFKEHDVSQIICKTWFVHITVLGFVNCMISFLEYKETYKFIFGLLKYILNLFIGEIFIKYLACQADFLFVQNLLW